MNIRERKITKRILSTMLVMAEQNPDEKAIVFATKFIKTFMSASEGSGEGVREGPLPGNIESAIKAEKVRSILVGLGQKVGLIRK